MGILDEAIKEHLELKRRHGAGEEEIRQLEDEAFGASERPGDEPGGDDLAEAPTQFMSRPDEPPEEQQAAEHRAVEAPEPEAAEEAPAEEAPAEEEVAQGEDEPRAEGEPSASGPSTEERAAIAEQPTELFDVEGELAAEEEGAEAEPEDEEDDDFWDEKRLSDELDQALEAPLDEPEPELGDRPEAEEAPAEAEGAPPVGGSGGPGSEDVLEETPEFLEENPDDDELWFEQKPPKDFDFDD